jgi:hypothetical protein
VSDLPPPVQRFLEAHIFSASQLEMLLLLRGLGDERVTLATVAQRTALPPSSIGPWLDAFVSRGLLGRDGDSYWYAPASAELAADLDLVADTYGRRKTTVTRFIYASTQDPLVRFADAFRIRRPEDPGRRPPSGQED